MDEFEKDGARVAFIDIRENPCFVGDISQKEVLEKFAEFVIQNFGHVDVRVNSISPGWIDTDFKKYEGSDALQQPAGRIGNPLDIANMVLYLASDKAGFITGENICIDGGMTRQMVYHNDCGWKYSPFKDF